MNKFDDREYYTIVQEIQMVRPAEAVQQKLSVGCLLDWLPEYTDKQYILNK